MKYLKIKKTLYLNFILLFFKKKLYFIIIFIFSVYVLRHVRLYVSEALKSQKTETLTMVVMTRRQQRKMAEAIAESPITILPDEMMLEIFSRVEISDTMQLRGVCKLWKSLAVDPQFVCNHFSRAYDEIVNLDSKAKKHLSEEEEVKEDKEEVVAITGDEGEVDEAKKCLMKSLADLDIVLEDIRILKERVEKINFDMQPLDDRLKSLKSL